MDRFPASQAALAQTDGQEPKDAGVPFGSFLGDKLRDPTNPMTPKNPPLKTHDPQSRWLPFESPAKPRRKKNDTPPRWVPRRVSSPREESEDQVSDKAFSGEATRWGRGDPSALPFYWPDPNLEELTKEEREEKKKKKDV